MPLRAAPTRQPVRDGERGIRRPLVPSSAGEPEELAGRGTRALARNRQPGTSTEHAFPCAKSSSAGCKMSLELEPTAVRQDRPDSPGISQKGLRPTFPLVRGPSEHCVAGEGFEPS